MKDRAREDAIDVWAPYLGESSGASGADTRVGMRTIVVSAALLLVPLVAGCGDADSPARDDALLGTNASAIQGGTIPSSSSWMTRSAAWVEGTTGCSGVVIGPRHVITGAHCKAHVGDTVRVYNSSTFPAVTVSVTSVSVPPCVSPANDDFNDCDGEEADIAVLRVDQDFASDRPRPLSYLYPGANELGVRVGSGAHENDLDLLSQVRWRGGETYSSAINGEFLTQDSKGNEGDSGGAFYKGGRLLGVWKGATYEWAAWRDKFITVPWHLLWILEKIGYQHAFFPFANRTIPGATLETFQTTSEIRCGYACASQAACAAYEFDLVGLCRLKSSTSGMTWHPTLRVGTKSINL